MLSSLVLDALLVLILLTIVPIGFFRGGLREVCTAAGLLLGILLAEQWAGRWGGWIADRGDIDEGATQFAVAVAIVVIAGGVIGYGSSAAFTYRPGPGGRLYGGYLALLNGVLLVGFLINAYVLLVGDGDRPAIIEDSYVARAVSVGFEWVLLGGAAGILLATLFGMFVREREEETYTYGPAPLSREPVEATAQRRRLATAPEPEKIEPPAEATTPTAPVRIREVRHWEDRAEPPQRQYGSGWQQTWPGAVNNTPARRPWEQQTSRQRPPASTPQPEPPKRTEPQSQKDILRQWMDQDRSESEE
jgi:hypothetical protein